MGFNIKICSKKGRAISLFFIVAVLSQFQGIKIQNSQTVTEGQQKDKLFFHPYLQVYSMLAAELIAFCLYKCSSKFLKKRVGRQQESEKEKQKKSYTMKIFILPACVLMVMSLSQIFAFNFVAPSTYSIFKGSSIFATLLFSKLLLKIKIEKRHIFSCSSAFFGLAIVGVSDLFFSDQNKTGNNQVIGYVLLIIGLFLNGFLDTYEKKLFLEYRLTPFQLITGEGIVGTIIMTVLILILSFIPCPFGVSKCVYNQENQPFFQQPEVYLKQVFHSWVLAILTIIFMIIIVFQCIYGASITKYFDALTRGLCTISKAALSWLIGILITVFVTNEAYKMQSLDWRVILVKAVGYGFVVVATLTYTGVLFNKFFKRSQNQGVQNHSNLNQELELT